MSLRYAVLASLLPGAASGYDLAKRMDVSVANFWHALPTQIYGELNGLERDGLVEATEVTQESRPTKRVFAVTEAGRGALADYTRLPSRPGAIKDELLIKVQASDMGDRAAVAAALDGRGRSCGIKLAVYEALIADLLRGRSEDAYLQTARRIGPYLNLRRGRDFERENLEWCGWAAGAIRARAR